MKSFFQLVYLVSLMLWFYDQYKIELKLNKVISI